MTRNVRELQWLVTEQKATIIVLCQALENMTALIAKLCPTLLTLTPPAVIPAPLPIGPSQRPAWPPAWTPDNVWMGDPSNRSRMGTTICDSQTDDDL